MGYYINPLNQSKDEWLAENGELIPQPAAPTENTVDVCLVQNTMFSAAGILYTEAEANYFAEPLDDRPKLFYRVEKAKILAIHPHYESIFA